MNILSPSLVFVFVLVEVQSDFLGYNELNLIEERKSFKIKCIPREGIPKQFNIIEVKWFNVTKKSTDPSDEIHRHVLLDETNEYLTILSTGELYSSTARSEHNGYYSCRVHYSNGRPHSKRHDHKLIDYRLHLIEVTKTPLVSKLVEYLVIKVYTDSESVNSEVVSDLLKNSIMNKDFETRIQSNGEKVFCEFNSKLNLNKCELKIRSQSKKKCHSKYCNSDQNVFKQKLEKDLQKMQTLFKTNEELFKSKLNTQLIDFEVNTTEDNPNQLSDCPEGYYIDSNRCRPCPSGQFKGKGEQTCHDCPVNTFNPYFGQSSCTHCPDSSLTAGPGFEKVGMGVGVGATHIHECKYLYGLGFYGFIKDLFNDIFD